MAGANTSQLPAGMKIGNEMLDYSRTCIFTVRKEQRSDIVKKIVNVLNQKKDIVFAFLYGSFATDARFRDIDIAIFVKNLDTSRYWDYEYSLSREIHRRGTARRAPTVAPYPIDVRIINNAPLSFRFHVIRGDLIFFNDGDFVTHYMYMTAKRYLDMAPLRHFYILEAMA